MPTPWPWTGKPYQAASCYEDMPMPAPDGKPQAVKIPGTFAIQVYGREAVVIVTAGCALDGIWSVEYY